MAVTFLNKKAATPTPTPPAEPDGILSALAQFNTKKGVLMLIHKENGTAYQVMGVDQQTGKVKLKGPNGELLNPIVGLREEAFYYPKWR